jgi:hypothetical protein
MTTTPAHDQAVSHKYTVHYPAHGPREGDPHYHLFHAYHEKYGPRARCYVGQRIGFDECAGGLELHHAHLEFAVQNAAVWEAVAKDYPQVHDQESLDRWVESEQNFRWLCVFHHRGHAGAHVASHADWEAEQYSPGLVT